jgi:ergothioneine biosynthesis protein EgtB
MNTPKSDVCFDFLSTRKRTEHLCLPLELEDFIPQPIPDVSPPKWHLGHTTWFFEQFVLLNFESNYTPFDPNFLFFFNSYYQNAGERVARNLRGTLSRPTVKEVLNYRQYVTSAVEKLLINQQSEDILELVTLGIHHEMQHQELLMYDIKYIFGMQPAQPIYGNSFELTQELQAGWKDVEGGIYEIGAQNEGFSYDNEKGHHQVLLNDYSISQALVSNREYLDFINSGGYTDFNLWHDEGWATLQNQGWKAPLYWQQRAGNWGYFTLSGFKEIDLHLPVQHVSYFEASAFAAWKNCRLPTEAEWEVASPLFSWGQLWEWTGSAYLPYPGFFKALGALGEYNGKFMVNQHVLRGASVATPPGHARKTYRNFFAPQSRWQFSGIRLVK